MGLGRGKGCGLRLPAFPRSQELRNKKNGRQSQRVWYKNDTTEYEQREKKPCYFCYHLFYFIKLRLKFEKMFLKLGCWLLRLFIKKNMVFWVKNIKYRKLIKSCIQFDYLIYINSVEKLIFLFKELLFLTKYGDTFKTNMSLIFQFIFSCRASY